MTNIARPDGEARSYPGASTGRDYIATTLFAHSTDILRKVALLLGNALDALFTFALLQLQLGVEANPVMRWVYQGSPQVVDLLVVAWLGVARPLLTASVAAYRMRISD